MTEQLPVTGAPADETGEPTEDSRRKPGTNAARFVRDHPVAAVAGAAAVGVVLAALVPKRNRQKIANSKIADKAGHWLELASLAGLALGRDVLERAEGAGQELRSRGESLAHRAERLGHHAADRASRLSGTAADRFEQFATPAGRKASAAGHRIADKISDKAAQIARRVQR